MSYPGWDWDTRDTGANRTGGGHRLAIVVAAALLTVAILAAVTGKVLASNPPVLPDSSPTADHTKASANDIQPEPPDPRSLFLDLPKPQAPETQPTNPNDRRSGSRGSAAGASEGSVSSNRSSGGVGNARGRERGAADIPFGVAKQRPAPGARAVKPGFGNAEDLLANPNCRFSDVARRDLKYGIVDEYLISALQAVCREHTIYVNVFKTGHTFGSGLPEGPTIPVGYGNAGGYPNTHYSGRAADIWKVDGKPVEGNGADPDVVSVGRMLAGLPSRNKPDVVIGPDAWNRALGYGPEQGWVLDGDQVALHNDHLHVGYWHGDGTPPPQIYLSPTQMQGTSYPTGGGEAQPPAVQRPGSNVDGSRARKTAKFKETIEPAESPTPKPRPARHAQERKDREKPEPQRTIIRRIQRPDSQKTAPQKTGSKKPGLGKTNPEATREPPREPRDRKPEPNIRPPADEEHSQEPGKTSAGGDQYTNIEGAQVQDEVVTKETTSGRMAAEDTETRE